MKNDFEKSLEDIINKLVKNSDDEKNEYINNNQEIVNVLKELSSREKSSYNFKKYLDLFLYEKLSALICSALGIASTAHNVYKLKNFTNGSWEHFFRRYIEKTEGSAFSVDKVRFIMNRMVDSLATGKNISLYRTYEGYGRIDKAKWSEQAYWSPKTIKETDQAFKLFNDWYYFAKFCL